MRTGPTEARGPASTTARQTHRSAAASGPSGSASSTACPSPSACPSRIGRAVPSCSRPRPARARWWTTSRISGSWPSGSRAAPATRWRCRRSRPWNMAEAVPDFTPVNLITGFLGSGKTTLLSRLLHQPALKGAAVLINEFGEVGLDHHLLEVVDDNIVLLQSGCLCCTIRGDLAAAMRGLLSKRERGEVPPFDRLLVESTGLADPYPILSTIRSDPV